MTRTTSTPTMDNGLLHAVVHSLHCLKQRRLSASKHFTHSGQQTVNLDWRKIALLQKMERVFPLNELVAAFGNQDRQVRIHVSQSRKLDIFREDEGIKHLPEVRKVDPIETRRKGFNGRQGGRDTSQALIHPELYAAAHHPVERTGIGLGVTPLCHPQTQRENDRHTETQDRSKCLYPSCAISTAADGGPKAGVVVVIGHGRDSIRFSQRRMVARETAWIGRKS